MRSWAGILLLMCGLGAGFVVGERLAGGEPSQSRLLRWVAEWVPGATPDAAQPAPRPAAEQKTAIPALGAREPAEIEIVTGGEVSVIADTPEAFVAAPIPLYRYFDGSGAIRMVEGLEQVPPRYRHSAVEIARDSGRINQVDIPPPASRAFRDWEPDPNPNRGGVVLFSAAGCRACAQARQHLERLGVAYQLRDIQRDGAAKDHVRRVMGRVVVPLLQVGGRYVSGYLPAEYDRLAQRG